MRQYQSLQKKIIRKGDVGFEPRTEEHVITIPGASREYDLRKGFPLLTTKPVYLKLAAEELFWKLRGEDSVKPLIDRGVNYWNKNAFDFYLKRHGLTEEIPKHSDRWREEFGKYVDRLKTDPDFAPEGTLGRVYGYQWIHGFKREGKAINQLENVINTLKKKDKRGSRYHILNAWNPADIPDMALPPCPFWHQFTATDDGHLDLTVTQRSCDTFLGIPYNIAQDALFLHMMARETGFEPRTLVHITINTHIYLGVEPRSLFWQSKDAVNEFKRKFDKVKKRGEYLNLKDWYLKEAGPESPGNEGKDHMPFVLEQLSKPPRKLPTIVIADELDMKALVSAPFATDVVKRIGYNPHKWNARAEMAA